MTVAYVSHSDCGTHDTGWNHPEHVGRLRAIPRALRYDFDLFDTIEHREGRHATADEIALGHDPRRTSNRFGRWLTPAAVASTATPW